MVVRCPFPLLFLLSGSAIIARDSAGLQSHLAVDSLLKCYDKRH